MFAIGALQYTALINVSFVIQEKPWRDSIIIKQHIFNEIIFYISLFFLVAFGSLP
jgi:hypothetical protein